MPERSRRTAEARARLAEIDRRLVAVLNERAHALREHGGAPDLEIETPEAAWLDKLLLVSSGEVSEASMKSLLRHVRAESRTLAQPIRVAYLGPEGGFSHQAAREHFGDGTHFIEAPSPVDLFEEVQRERAHHVVFPFESSVDGLLQANVSALAATDLVLTAQIELVTRYDLVGRAAAGPEIQTVYATASALAACERLLARALANARVEDVRSAVLAARRAADDPEGAAIVPEIVGQSSVLRVLQTNVADAPNARVRFAVGGRRPASRTGRDATCLLFAVSDQPGALYAVLRHFAERDVNLRRMQARPATGEGFDYVFFVEVEGHVTDRPLVTALEGVKKATRYLRLLGSFPVGT
jgi:chorismate mutase / prephenate dehydratase